MTHATVRTMHVTATHHARVTVARATTVSIRRHTVALVVWVRTGTHSREGAAEACSAALEVGEATARAGPVTRTWAVLRRREGSEERRAAWGLRASGAVEDA